MKKPLTSHSSTSFFFLLVLVFTGWTQATSAQIANEDLSKKQSAGKQKIVVYKAGQPEEQAYDYGRGRFLLGEADTQGAWSLIEITEEPGYKTPLHRHNSWDESFYVLAGTLTAKLADSIYTLPAGSFMFIPRGTAHGQANFGNVPVKLLITITPSGFERHIKDRMELFKTVKPGSPQFSKGMDSLRKKNAQYIEFLGAWDKP